MPPPQRPPRSLADVAAALRDRGELPPHRQRDMLSALHRVGALLGAPLEELPPHLAELRPRLGRILPAAHGLRPKTWQNIRSNLVGAVRLTTPADPRQRQPASPAWRALRRLLPDKRTRNGLSRFLAFCDRHGVAPDGVSDAVADRFATELATGTLVAKPRDLHRRTCRLWNEMRRTPGWPQVVLTVPDYGKPRTTVPASGLAPSLQRELGRYVD